MTGRVRWGVLGAAKIALTKVIPAMQASNLTEVVALASRDAAKAQAAAERTQVRKVYGSYEELLQDPEVDCIYNPLPNHLHVPWSIRAAEAGKHVLCEKPIALTASECRELIAARDRTGVRIGEAFMVRTHPQWLRARELVRSGHIGELRAMVCAFSYSNRDRQNVRNIAEYGGGGLMDIGCYPIQVSRFLFEQEPVRVSAAMQFDPEFHVDRLTSGLLEFPSGGHCTFTCSTQLIPYQRVHIFGMTGRIEIEIPFNAPPDRSCRIFVDTKGDLFGGGISVEELPVCDQYTIQGDAFSRAVLDGGEVPTSLEDSLANMEVIEAMRRAAARK
ncbi:MAG TPA: Gfo/Idh/MocA family oxidoreductase [Bryobacteraceae bacterium]|nr:Gfo/Idh/MocA family oxidoreductase [Bryobacteraceae bacterium]